MDEGPGAILSFKTFLSFINRLLVTNIQLKTSREVFFLPPSDAYVTSFLYLLYTLIKLYYPKALSNQALSLALDWILLWRPRIPASFHGSVTTFQYPHLFTDIPQFVVIHTVKGFGIVNKAEVDVFLKLSCFFYDTTDTGNLISGSFAFSKYSLNICKFSVHVLLKPGLENFWALLFWCVRCMQLSVVWIFFGITFLWFWNENWPCPVLWPLLSFPNLLAYWVQHFHRIIF